MKDPALKYYSYRIQIVSANYNAVNGFQQQIAISSRTDFTIKQAYLTGQALITSTAKGSIRCECHGVGTIFGFVTTQPIVKVAAITDVSQVAILNGVIVPFSTFVPFKGSVSIPAGQVITVDGQMLLPASLYAGFATADVTAVTITGQVLIGWEDDLETSATARYIPKY
jgi:hypothetical protein